MTILLSACGGGVSNATQSDTAIHAINVVNKESYLELAERQGKRPVTFDIMENVAYMQGVMDSTIPHLVSNLIANFPDVDTIIMLNALGTIDFHATLEAGYLIRDACLKTVVPVNARITSGAVYLFMAGCERIIEKGGQLGVHTWKLPVYDDNHKIIGGTEALGYSIYNAVHEPYLTYQIAMDIPESFYWFMINKPFDEMYFLSNREISEFNFATKAINSWGAGYKLVIDINNPIINPGDLTKFGTAKFYVEDNIATLHGLLNHETSERLLDLLDTHSAVDTIEFGYVPGTVSGRLENAIALGELIHEKCLTTKIGHNSYVIGAAVNAYVGGCHKIFHQQGSMGVLSWQSPAVILMINEPESLNNKYMTYFDAIGVSRDFFQLQLELSHDTPTFLTRDDLLGLGVQVSLD